MNESVITLNDVSKEFRLYNNPITGPIKELLMPWQRSAFSKRFWAVKDANMEVKRGEVVGIIGPNGAGKTTLLKMIAGLLPVDKGSISVKGKITALLALGVGVHPEFSGRENIYFGGLLLGMTREEVNRKMEGIIEFAELGEFINQPFRTYSSGMKARLLFAISMSIDPDILIVDEALATGDSYFLSKSRKKILELCKSGATILFVSHNLAQIQELCGRAYFMAKGAFLGEGSPNEMIAEYNRYIFKDRTENAKIQHQNDLISTQGTEITVENIEIINTSRNNSKGYYTGDGITIKIYYKRNCKDIYEADLFLGFLQANDSLYVSEFNTVNYFDYEDKIIKRKSITLEDEGAILVEFPSLLLLNNTYGLWIILYMGQSIYCEYKNVCHFFVGRENNSIMLGDAFFWHPGLIVKQ